MIKKIMSFIFAILISFVFIPNNIDADSIYEYTINSYDIDINVKEDNTLNITERIGVYFNVEKHGIFRKIPLTNNIVRNDGSTSKNRVKLTNIRVSDNYTTSYNNDDKVIRIGSEDTTLTGEKNYTISYSYGLGKDPLKDIDELYYNLIGTEWDTTISNVTFKITMPKEFDESKLGFSSGYMGTIGSEQASYYVDGNTIIGAYYGTLNPGEAITVRLELPEGYFTFEGVKLNLKTLSTIILPIIFAIVSYLIWKKYGKDDPVIETVEFYPPEGFNSLEVGFIFKGNASNKDITSLLIYLANKGYLKIEEYQKEYLKYMKEFKVTKLKEYDGNNENEKMFMEGLFKNNKTEVTSEELYNKFYKTTDKILKNINKKENKRKLFEKSSTNKSIYLILMSIITFCLMTIPPFIYYGDMELMGIAISFTAIGYPIVIAILVSDPVMLNPDNLKGSSKVIDVIMGIIFGAIFIGLPFMLTIYPIISNESIFIISYVVGVISLFISNTCLVHLKKRTKYGNEMFGKLKGFKSFLETAEKEKLEALVLEDPTYFYNILPYTYVLGVSDKWIKKFESISMQPPTWYVGDNFSMNTFGTFMNSTMRTASSALGSPTSSGSGGGGSSGGGSGGGGGGSW